VPTGEAPTFVGVDQAAHTLFTLDSDDYTLAEINTMSCGGPTTSGCPAVALNEQASPEAGPGFTNFPNGAVFTWQNDSAYLVNVGGNNVLSVVSVARCNALDTSGCRVEAPSVPDPEYWATIDQATGTLYASNENDPQIDVIEAATCEAEHVADCTPVAKSPVKDPSDALGAIDSEGFDCRRGRGGH
jgi:DNA-binding beta-propeller fold protein YncE